MKYGLKISNSAIARTAGLALVAVLAVSFIGLTQADNTFQLTVNVNDVCGPVVAQVTVVNGPDDGAFGITNNQGQFIFNSLHAGIFYLHIAAADHNSKDTGTVVLDSDQTVNVTLDRTNGGCGGPPPTCTTGTISVTSNLPAAAYFITRPDGTTFGWNGSNTFANQPLGNYSIRADDVPGYTKTIPSGTTGTLVGCGTLTAVINYTSVTTPSPTCTTGTVNVVSNLAASPYFITRPNGTIFGWNGSHTFADQSPLGTYSIRADNVSGYNPPTVIPASGNLAGCGILNFAINYQPVSAVGTITINKLVRNATQGQSIFTNSTSANPGDMVEFQIQISAQNGAVGNVTVSDSLPARLIYVNNSLTIDGSQGGNNLGSISFGSITSGQTKTIKFRATVSDASQFPVGNTLLTNTANGTSASNSTSAQASVTVGVSQSTSSLSITKLVRDVTQGQTVYVNSTGANPGDQVQFQMQVTNNGSGTAQNVIVNDSLPNNMTLTSGSTTFNLGNLVPGASQTVNLTATIAGANNFTCGITNLNNSASASATNANSVSATAVVSVNNNNCGGSSNLSVSKTVRNLTQGQSIFIKSISANPSDTVQFQIQVTVNGQVAAQNVNVTDNLPGNMTLSSGSTTFNLGTMNAGSSQTVTLSAQIAGSANFSCNPATLTNTAFATSNNSGNASDNATVFVNATNLCAQNNPVTLSLTKEVRNLTSNSGFFASSTTANNGDQVQFRLTVRNNNWFTLNNVRLTDFLPFGLSYIPGTFQIDSGSTSGSLFSGTEFIGTLFAGQSRTIMFNAQVNSSTNQTLTNQATAAADNANSVSAQATVNVVGTVLGSNVNLIQTKRAFNQTRNTDATLVTANSDDIILYTLSVQNIGNAVATNYVFQDDLSDVLQLSMLQDFSDGSFNLGNLTLVWPAVSINPGSTVTKTFTVKVNSSFGAGLDNIMTNTFGNTINVQVNKPTVLGAFVSPKTGATTNIVFVLSMLTVAGFIAMKKRQQVKLLFNHLIS